MSLLAFSPLRRLDLILLAFVAAMLVLPQPEGPPALHAASPVELAAPAERQPTPKPVDIGRPVPVFLLGAGSDLTTYGLNETVLNDGWSAAVDRVFIPRITEFLGPPLDQQRGAAPPAGRIVLFHLPHGRSPVGDGPLADMPFDGLPRLQEAVRRGNVKLAKAADATTFVRAMTRLVNTTRVWPSFYLGTVDHGHRQQWADYTAVEFARRVEASAGVYQRLQVATGVRVRVWIDAGGVQDERSNSWQVRLVLERMGLLVGTEPWISIEGAQWARDSAIDVLVLSEFLPHVNPDWALPREAIGGRVLVLWQGDPTQAGDRSEIAKLLAAGKDVGVGAFQVRTTSAQWRAEAAAIAEAN